ncbi:MAG: zf-HC2 domain-containing protein [Planctomycetes bacterium]|nr:zf-HC2 domain-containing protein [Planctomycetota bacterium]
MTCSEFTEFLDAYLAGDISPAERDEFKRHLAACKQCVDYLATYERTVKLGKDAFEEPGCDVADKVPEDLVKAILAARNRK